MLPLFDASAAEEVWIGGNGAAWSVHGNWLDGSAPPTGGAADLSLRFTGLTENSPGLTVADNDLSNGFLVNGLRFDNGSGNMISIGGLPLELGGIQPEIAILNSGESQISSALRLNPTVGDVRITSSGSGSLILSGPISELGGARSLIIDANAAVGSNQTISLLGNSSFSGGVTLQNGTLRVGGSAALGMGPLRVNGGRLQLSQSSINNPIILGTDLLISGSGSLQGVISGTAGIVLRAAANISVSQASTYTGPTLIGDGGLLTLLSTASIRNSSRIDVSGNSLLILNPGDPDRIGDSAPVNVRSGGLFLRQSEAIGALSGAGENKIVVRSAGGPGLRLSATSLNRVERGTFLFEGENLGATLGGNVSQVVFTNPPLADLVGGSDTGPSTRILPYAIRLGDPFAPAPVSFVTYDASTGIRPLNSLTDFAQSLEEAAPTDNVRLTASEGNLQNLVINSLTLDGDGAILGEGTLSIASGALLGRHFGVYSIRNNLAFGSREANVFVQNDQAIPEIKIAGVVSGTGGLTKSGNGTLTLQAGNSFTGPLTINSGTLSFSALSHLGPDVSTIALNGGNLRVSGESPLTLARDIRLGGGSGTVTAGAVAASNNLVDLVLNGTITGPGGLRLSAEAGRRILLSGSNSYAGETTIARGEVVIGSDAAFGAGEKLSVSGDSKLTLTGDWVANRSVSITPSVFDFNATAVIDTAGSDATLRQLEGAFGAGLRLTKTGIGRLRMLTPQSYAGELFVTGGSVELGATGSIQSPALYLSRGGTLLLDNVTTAVSNRVSDRSLLTLAGDGRLELFGNSSTPLNEKVETLVLREGGNTITLLAPGAVATVLTIDRALASQGDLFVRATQLGGKTRVILGVPPAPKGGIIPNIFVAPNAQSAATSFAVYDQTTDAGGVIGLRALAPAELTLGTKIQNPENGGTTTQAAHFLATAPTTTEGAVNTIGSLTLDAGASITLGATQKLRISTGGILSREGASAASINGGTIDFGAEEGNIYTGADTTISSTITGSSAVRKTGPATLTFAGTAAWTSPPSAPRMTLGQGRLRLGPGELLAHHEVDVQTAGIFDLNNTSTAIGGLLGSGAITLESGDLTIGRTDTGLTVNFSGMISGSGRLILSNGGSLSGKNTFTGGVVLNAGPLITAGESPLGAGTLTINGGSLGGNYYDEQTINNPILLNAELAVRGRLNIAPGAVISGNRGVKVINDLRIRSASTYTGETRSVPGEFPEIRVSGSQGSVLGSSAIRVSSDGSFEVDNTVAFTGGAAGRLGDDTPIYLDGGRLALLGNEVLPTREKIGVIHGAGFSSVSVSPQPTATAVLEATALQRVNRGTFHLSGSNSLSLVTLPSGLTGGGGNGSETSIYPHIVGAVDPFNTDLTLVTSTPDGRLRNLNPDEFHPSLAGAGPTRNVRLTGVTSNNASLSVNSLVLDGFGAIEGPGTVEIKSGALLQTGFPGQGIANAIAFGAAEANVFVRGQLTLSGDLSGTAGLTKSGDGTLVLAGQKTFSGPLTINSGAIGFTAADALGADTSPILLNGLGSALNYGGSAPLRVARDLEIGAGAAALLTTNFAPEFAVAGELRGSGALAISGRVALEGQNNFTGHLTIGRSSTLRIATLPSLGPEGDEILFSRNSMLIYSGATAGTLTRPLRFDGSRFTGIQGGVGLNLSRPLSGFADLRLRGDVTLSANSPEYFGAATAEQGTVTVNGVLGGDSFGATFIVAGNGSGTLRGSGAIQMTIVAFGVLAPGNGIGTLRAGGLEFHAGGEFRLELASVSAFDQLQINGTATLLGPIDLSLNLSFNPQDGVDSFVIIDNDGTDAVVRANNGAFRIGATLLDEGARFSAEGQDWSISYRGGSNNNDVVLSAVPEPTTIALLIVVTGFASMRRNRRP